MDDLCIISMQLYCSTYFFFFNDTATTEIYTLSLHDALPISAAILPLAEPTERRANRADRETSPEPPERFESQSNRSEEHTSELQSLAYLVCRLLLEKKKNHLRCILASTHLHTELFHQ